MRHRHQAPFSNRPGPRIPVRSLIDTGRQSANGPKLALPKNITHTIQSTYWLSSSKNRSRNFSPSPAVIPTELVKHPPQEPSHV
jgi:hypothetical protein